MQTIEEIAAECYDSLEPAIARNIENYEKSNHPELQAGSSQLKEYRRKRIAQIQVYIEKAVSQLSPA